MSGALVVVGTPIGNLGDLTPRAVDALSAADLVACEDTRRTGRLLAHAGVDKPDYVVVNDHTEAREVGRVLARLDAGDRVALVTDAGMPGIADPGARLVSAALDAGHRVEVVPGPTAAVAALVASGMAAGRWCYEGFLPRKGSARRRRLQELVDEPRTVVLYEAPHRLTDSLGDLRAALGEDRRVTIARELTKLHEEVWRGTLAEAVERFERTAPRGEIVVVVEGAPAPSPPADEEVAAALRERLGRGISRRDAAAEVARDLGVPRRRAYELAAELS